MHAAEAVSPPLSIVSLGDVGGGGGVSDRATRGACSAGSGWAEQYLTSLMGELQNSRPAPPRVLPLTPRLMVDLIPLLIT